MLAKYNQITNQDMIEVLEGVEPSKLTENLRSYYGSILGILNHHLLADIGWIRILGTHIAALDFIPPLLERFPTNRPPPNELIWTSLDEYKLIRVEIDNLLERVVKTLDLSQFSSILTIEGRRGKMEYMTWRILLHLFNHHTHHRGGVAVLLDQLGVENDYSSLLWKV
ncbi:MAG: DinB family protein [Promethearchaeota archaeon]